MLLVGTASVSCSTIPNAPAPPTIELYMHDRSAGLARCAKSDGGKCPAKPMAETHKYFMLSPADWKKNQNYIDTLICLVEGGGIGCKSIDVENSVDEVEKSGPSSDLRRVRDSLRRMEARLKSQVRG